MADFNNDERIDVAIVSSTTNQLEIYCQLLDGTYPSTFNFTTTLPSTPTSIACGDLSGNGTSDLAIGCGSSRKIALVYEENDFHYGGGADELTTYYAVYGVGIADFDIDGRSDVVALVSSGSSSAIEFHFWQKAYEYGFTHPIAGSPHAEGLCVTDFDGDSQPDVVVTDSAAGRLTVVWNNMTAAGVLEDLRDVRILTSITGLSNPVKPVAKSMITGEPDHLIITMQSGSQINEFRYSGTNSSGTGYTATPYRVVYGATNPAFAVLADCTGTIKPDVLVVSAIEGTVKGYISPSGTTYNTAPDWRFPILATPTAGATADVDQDGDDDLVIATALSGAGAFTIYYNDEGIGNANSNAFFGTSDGSGSATAGDFDGDGSIEYCSLMSSNTVVRFIDAHNTTIGTKSLGADIRGILAYDLNDDGADDLVAIDYASGNISFCWGGVSFFSASSPSYQFTLNLTHPQSITLVNYTRDGHMDLAIGCDGGFQVLKSSGSGNLFEMESTLTVATGPGPCIAIASGDLNVAYEPTESSKRNDIVIVNGLTNNITIFIQNPSDGTMSPAPYGNLKPFTSGTINWMGVGLIDGDGLSDIVATTSGGQTTILWQDLSSGFNINNKVLMTSSDGVGAAALGDVDGDGLDELAVVRQSVKVVSIVQYLSGGVRVTHNYTAGSGDVRVALTDCDGDERTDLLFFSPGSASLSMVRQNNLVPVAAAHCLDDMRVEGYEVRFEAFNSTDSYVDLATLDYNWTFPDGTHGSGPFVTHRFSSYGMNMAVVLRVTDRSGSSSTDTTLVNVTESMPTALFAPSTTSPFEGDQVTFSDQSSSSGNDVITAWQWEFGDGTTQAVQNPVKTYTSTGIYVVNLTVVDDDGDPSVRSSMEITVQNRPLVAAFDPPAGTYIEGDQAHFISLSYPTYGSDTITSWTWNFHDGSPIQYGEVVDHLFLKSGTFTVTLTVTDDDGVPIAHDESITILDRDPIVDFTYNVQNPIEGQNITFTDKSTVYDSSGAVWTWRFSDGRVSTGHVCTINFTRDGDYWVNLTVVETDGDRGWKNGSFSIDDIAPSADFYWSANTDEGTPIHFYDNSTHSPYTTIVSWYWFFGDGATSTQRNPSHAFDNGIDYSVTLRVTDSHGNVSSISITVKVNETDPMIISFGSSTGTIYFDKDEVISFVVSAAPTYDSIRYYQWCFSLDSTSLDPRSSFINQSYSLLGPTTWSFNKTGTYRIGVMVWDKDSASFAYMLVQVNGTAPEAEFRYIANGDGSVTFDASLSTDTVSDLGYLTYSWRFGDGSPQTSPSSSFTTNHMYSVDGTYTVQLIVYDRDGLASLPFTTDIVVDRSDRAYPVISNITYIGAAQLGHVITITASVTDGNGTIYSVILFYSWNGVNSSVPMVKNANGQYSAEIPALNTTGTLTYWIEAMDAARNMQTSGFLYLNIGSDTTPLLIAIVVLLAIVFALLLLYLRAARMVVDEVFIIYEDGNLIAHQTRRLKPGMDDQILGSMLVAIQDFVRDSFKDESATALNRMDFGEKKVLVERGDHIYLAVVLHGKREGKVPQRMRDTITTAEADFHDALAGWDGDLDKVRGIKDRTTSLLKGSARDILPSRDKKDEEPLAEPEKSSPAPETIECPVCDATVPIDSVACPNCGAELSTRGIDELADVANEVKKDQ